MKLSTLLDAHRTFSTEAGALKESFGDGYLLNKNRVYSKVRAKSLASGFHFSNQVGESYLALSLSQLDSIMAKKQIPYLNNVRVLEEIESKIPKLTVWDDISDNLKGNHVFHESCHAVAKTMSKEFAAAVAPGSVENKVLLLLLEESFANACELVAIADADDQIHRVFYELNSYVFMLDDRANLAAAIKEIGFATVIRFLVLAYLHANFLRPLEEKDFERAIALAAAPEGLHLDAKHKKSLRAIAKIAFKLNPRFREVTTRFYLKLTGVNTTVNSLSRFDFLKVIEANPSATQFLARVGGCFAE
jgi:hypothetical protein